MLKRENRLSRIVRIAGERKYFSYLFQIRVSESKDSQAKFGFVVSKKIDKRAVVRNRTKRVLRDAAGKFLGILGGKNIVVVAKKSLSSKEKEEVIKEFKNIFKVETKS